VKVVVDHGKCTGHARCAALAPDVYQLDDEGYNALQGEVEVPAGLEDQARDGAEGCPERAITIID
jgi:ferredoxin